MKKLLFAIFGALLLCSCSGNSILDEERTFDNNVWNHFKAEEFDVDVTNIEDYYHIDVSAEIDTAVYRYRTLPLLVKIDAPAGEHRSFYAELPFFENGRPRGEVSDGYRKADRRLRDYFSFNSTGVHHIAIVQTTSQYDLEGVHSFRFTIGKSSIDYDL